MKKLPRYVFVVAICFGAMVPAQAQQNSCLGHETADVQFEARTFPAQKIGDAVLFHAGMYVDADGAPNAYGPHNRGLDFTANAVRDGRFLSVATHPDGNRSFSGREGSRASTFPLLHCTTRPAAATSPGTYVDARKIPYIVLPPEFMKQFGVALGDLAVVTNQKNGKHRLRYLPTLARTARSVKARLRWPARCRSMTIRATAVPAIPALPTWYFQNPGLGRANSDRRKRSRPQH